MRATLHIYNEVRANCYSATEKVTVLKIEGTRALVRCGQGRTQYCNVNQLNMKKRRKRASEHMD